MEFIKMDRSGNGSTPLELNVHPIYGAIYQDGEFVQRGAVLGLSVDAREVVVAPISGWVKVLDVEEDSRFVRVEIWDNRK